MTKFLVEFGDALLMLVVELLVVLSSNIVDTRGLSFKRYCAWLIVLAHDL